MVEKMERRLQIMRIVSLVAATVLALACGTNYAYSAWGPQYAERLLLSSTQQNLIGTSANMGMYLLGMPLGKFVDSRGARTGALCGSVLLGIGYFGLYQAYVNGPGSAHIIGLCILSAMNGAGGCVAFLGGMKTCAINFPTHRGTATSFPLAAFGLSAFFFSTLAGTISNDTDEFLLVVTIGSFVMTFIPSFFMMTMPSTPAYTPLPSSAPRASRFDHQTRKPKARESSRKRDVLFEPGTQHEATTGASSSASTVRDRSTERPPASLDDEIQKGELRPSLDEPTTEEEISSRDENSSHHHSLFADIRGFSMLKHSQCWEIFILVGLLTGTGLMTINNVGNDAKALWKHWDANATHDWIQSRQRIHVSILSVCSFTGRLLGGIGSDYIVKQLHGTRFWCVFASSCVFTVAQIIGLSLENPNFLVLLSGTTGLAYGILFGVAPTLVAETFGVNGLSQNWGFMTLSPAFFGEIFNLIYGRIYDVHSIVRDGGVLECTEGLACYQGAYWVTFGACVTAMLVTFWCIKHRQATESKMQKLEEEGDADHVA